MNHTNTQRLVTANQGKQQAMQELATKLDAMTLQAAQVRALAERSIRKLLFDVQALTQKVADRHKELEVNTSANDDDMDAFLPGSDD